MLERGKIVVLGLAVILATSGLCSAADLDLTNMTATELNNLKSQIEDELDANHEITSSERTDVEDVSKNYIHSLYGEDNVEWAWIDYTYTKDWDFYTMKTHAKITKQDGGDSDYKIYTEVIDDGNQYQVIYAKVGDEEVLNERNKITDARVLKSLGLEVGEAKTEKTDIVEEKSSETDEKASEPTTEAEINDVQLAVRGDQNDTVRNIQDMLIRLQYLSGGADGQFGGQTEEAIKKYQMDHGLEADGIVTQSLYDVIKAEYDVAPVPKEYQSLGYTDIQRNPDSYKDVLCKFSGRVIQVSEGWFGGVTLRIEQDGSYDRVWYVEYSYSDGESKILEDDYVTVYGTCEGTKTYTTIMGASVTIPACTAERIELN